MNLLDIKKQLLTLSGRTDLIDPNTYADVGIGYYINAGQKWLDLRLVGKRARGRNFTSWRTGTYMITIPQCRVIEEVWIYDDEKRVKLSKKSVEWLKTEYPNDWRAIENSVPKYYAPMVTQMNPDPSKASIGNSGFPVNQANVIMTDATGYDGILILPPPEDDIGVEVVGHFYSNALVEDDDISWWSVNHPSMLVNATLREVEIGHRNTQGVNDWTAALAGMLLQLDFDGVEEEIVDLNQIEG